MRPCVQSSDHPSSEQPLFELEQAFLESLEATLKDSSALIPSLDSSKPLHVLPLLRRPFFPGMSTPIMIPAGPYQAIIKHIAAREDKTVALLLTKKEDADIYKLTWDDVYHAGVLAKLVRIIPIDNQAIQVLFSIEKRIILDTPQNNLPLCAIFKEPEMQPLSDVASRVFATSIISTVKELLQVNPLFKEELQILMNHTDYTDPSMLADFAITLTSAPRDELQDLLATFSLKERLEKTLLLLLKELDIAKLQGDLREKIESGMTRTQRDFFLREQLKIIRKELGVDRDDKLADREKFQSRIKERTIPAPVLTVIEEELQKWAGLEATSPDYSLTRNYIDWLTTIPWGITSPCTHTLQEASAILEEDHYGLEEVKERLLECVGIQKLTRSCKGSILCLVGPPGVGKTSIGRSVARALGRPFYRFSLGGMRDEAEIKGHRRTYIGAMPGKLIQALKACKVMNPVIMLDEVDKVGSSYRGDPASALLEVLDPEQNSSFLDYYLDLPCDLSEVFFICTANVLDTIPEPLKDRMEILRLSGYLLEEKIAIAETYLIPRHCKEMGLDVKTCPFAPDVLPALIQQYAREAGVRSLEHEIKKILRKIAMKVVRKTEEPEAASKGRKKRYPVSVSNLKEYLGVPRFTSECYYQTLPCGVSTGLAWTALGGAILYVESVQIPAEKTVMKLTGRAGEVMKESAQIAWSYLHSALLRYVPHMAFFPQREVHLHIPEGATPKDGPSAGVTLVTSLLSLLTEIPIPVHIGMTGELTLTGLVLPVGGIQEKLVAAKRAGLTTLFLPTQNRPDYTRVKTDLQKSFTIHFVEHYDEIFKHLFVTQKMEPRAGRQAKNPPSLPITLATPPVAP